MPVDIAPLVTADYSAAIPAPLDGEYANSASLQGLVLPIANRVEYLRQGIESAPWREWTFFEDFGADILPLNGDHFMADSLWHANGDWGLMAASNIPSVDADETIGQVVMQNSSGGILTGIFRKSEGAFVLKDLRRLVARVQLGTIATGNKFFFGAHFVGDTPAIRAGFDPAVGANWQLQSGGGSVHLSTGVVATTGVWYVLDLEHDGAGTWTLSVNGSVPVTCVSGIPTITDTATAACEIDSPNSGASRFVYLDYLYGRALNQARV